MSSLKTYVLFCVHNGHVFVELSLMFILRSLHMFLGKFLQISTMFTLGEVRFSWKPLDYSLYDVLLTKDDSPDAWVRVSDSQYTVKHVLLYDSIRINVRTSGSNVINVMTYNGLMGFFSYIFLNINYLINWYVQLCLQLYNFVPVCLSKYDLGFQNNTLTHLITLFVDAITFFMKCPLIITVGFFKICLLLTKFILRVLYLVYIQRSEFKFPKWKNVY